MKTANFPGRKKTRRERALARFSFAPGRADNAEYMARKLTEKATLERRTQ
jgi:hypothetical protein